jgi:hypothetical protein
MGNKAIDGLMTILIKGSFVLGILWIIADITGLDETLLIAKNPPVQIMNCVDATKLTNDGGRSTAGDSNIVKVGKPMCVAVNKGTVKNIVLKVHDSRCSLVETHNKTTYDSRPDFFSINPASTILVPKQVTDLMRREYTVKEQIFYDAGLDVVAVIFTENCPFQSPKSTDQAAVAQPAMAGREPAVAHESQVATPQVVQPPLMAFATLPPTIPTHPDNAPIEVKVPRCSSDTWSETINLPVGWKIQSGWSMSVVKASWRQEGQWIQSSSKVLSGSFDAVRYCANIDSYHNQTMLLNWIK